MSCLPLCDYNAAISQWQAAVAQYETATQVAGTCCVVWCVAAAREFQMPAALPFANISISN